MELKPLFLLAVRKSIPVRVPSGLPAAAVPGGCCPGTQPRSQRGWAMLRRAAAEDSRRRNFPRTL